jgi:hypothetical protein
MWRIQRRRRRRLRNAGLAALAIWLVLWLVLPYDSTIVLAFRFNGRRLLSYLPSPWTEREEKWRGVPPRFEVDLAKDVAVISKTGYGTQARMQEHLAAMDVPGGIDLAKNVLVIADFATSFRIHGMKVEAHNVVDRAVHGPLAPYAQHADRLLKYRDMTKAIEDGDEMLAGELNKQFGWELDAMKFMPGLELAWKTMPGRTWYVMVDDDTYLVQPSLRALLGHLDPDVPAYVGNAVGDFRRRFAHGGSAFLISGVAMAKLFRDNKAALSAAYVQSLAETWGDRLVAAVFMKVGVYLDERYSRFFNGESPQRTMVRADRICSPLVSFHELKDSRHTKELGDTFREIDQTVRWGDLWDLYNQSSVASFATHPMHYGEDHVGIEHQATLFQGRANSAERCLAACEGRGAKCLAWTWEEARRRCYHSGWFIVGEGGSLKTVSGINVVEVSRLYSRCRAKT